jgi:hypothetical protein
MFEINRSGHLKLQLQGFDDFPLLPGRNEHLMRVSGCITWCSLEVAHLEYRFSRCLTAMSLVCLEHAE